MDTRKRGSTSEMQVTSIRLKPELKERLREISGEQGDQTLIREVLWQFVEQQLGADEVRWRSLSERESYSPTDRRAPSHPSLLSMSDIQATFLNLKNSFEALKSSTVKLYEYLEQPHQSHDRI